MYTPVVSTPKALLKSAVIIHLALLAGQVLFGIVAVALFHQLFPYDHPQNQLFLYLVPVIALSAVALSVILFSNVRRTAISQPSLPAKLQKYQNALILCYLPLEAASFFSIVAYILTGNLLYILVSALLAARFITIRPTVNKTIEDLKLNTEEQLDLR